MSALMSVVSCVLIFTESTLLAKVYCGRYAQGHMLEHHNTTQHPIVLSLADLSAWCYVCNSYIHNEVIVSFFLAPFLNHLPCRRFQLGSKVGTFLQHAIDEAQTPFVR